MQTFDIDVTPKGINPVVYCSQKDIGRQIKFYLFDGALSYTPPANSKIFVEGRKPDNRGFSYECTYSGNEVTVILTQQMTIFADDIPCELRVIDGVNTIGTLNFVLRVEESPVNENVPVSETEIPTIIELAREQEAAAAASAILAESFAKGGTNSRTGEDTDNSKYYKEQSASSASDAAQSASDALTSETNAATSESNASTYATNALNSATAASGSASNAAQSASDAANSATLAEQYADFVTPHFIVENNRLYIKDDAVGEFVVANNRLYIKLAS